MRRDSLQFGLRLLHTHAWFQAAEGLHEHRTPVVNKAQQRPGEHLLAERDGQPDDFRIDERERSFEVLWRHADYGVRLRVERNRLPHDVAIATELLRPRAVAEHADRLAAALVLVGKEKASQRGLQPKHVEVIAAHQQSRELLRFALGAHRQAGEREDHHAAE